MDVDGWVTPSVGSTNYFLDLHNSAAKAGAMANCNDIGAELLTPKNADENGFVASIVA